MPKEQNIAQMESIEDLCKIQAIGMFTSDGETAADYDSFMDEEGGDEDSLTIWQPFENHDKEEVREYVESAFDSFMDLADKIVKISQAA